MINVLFLRLPTLFLLILINFSLIFSFGKNKVQYENFKWKKVQSPHFNIFYHQDEDTLAEIVPVWIEEAFQSLNARFHHKLRNRIPLIVYGNTNLFTQTNIITELLPEEVGGFTELFKNRIAIPFNGSYKDLRHVLHHELTHAYFFSMLFEQFGSNILAGNVQLPLWFMEGSAEFLSSGWDADADMFMIDRTLNAAIPLPGPGLNGYMAYKGGQSFLFYLASSRGDSLFQKFLIKFKKTKKVEASIEKVYKTKLQKIGKEWVLELRRLYWPEIGCRINPDKQGKALTDHMKTYTYFNLRPRISPDGAMIAYFSDHRDYTRIMICDTSGKIIHEVSQYGYGGYFESFHPFRSGMCWSPDGKKIAFVTKSNGSDEIRIVDIKRKKLIKRIRTKLNSISSPDWSRDGSELVFSSVDNGMRDLYSYSIYKDSLSRLTNSLACESDPRFSPDGGSVIFSIEDTSGLPPDLTSPYGRTPSDLAVLNIATGNITRYPSTPWNEKEPCYSPDGNHIVFVSNRNGINNLYIAPTDSFDEAQPLTNYTGGSSNPDWSREGNKLVFSLFNMQGWDIRMIHDPMRELLPDTLVPTRWVASFNDTTLQFFSTVELPIDSADSTKKAESVVKNQITDTTADTTDTLHSAIETAASRSDSDMMSDTSVKQSARDTTKESDTKPEIENNSSVADASATSTPDSTSDSTDAITVSSPQPYRLTFSPDMVSVGLGVSTMYSPAGQVLIALSDLLGDHRITFAGDLQGDLNDYAHFFLSYFFLKHRLDVGAGAYYSKDYTYASVFGSRLYHDMEYGGFGIAQYPFSMFSRLDFSLFARHIEQRPVYSEGPEFSANMLLGSLSYVYDNILWGLTGPLNGTRAVADVQLSPPLSFIAEPFVSIELDWRKYIHLFKRFVWANRVFLGASFPLGNESSARRYLLGGNDQWFIYQVNIDEYEKNMPYTFYSDFVTPFRGWEYVDFSGTRVGVINSEFRFPFIKEISLVWPLPLQINYINGALFADIGNTWEEKKGLPDKVYGGVGFGMRANLGIFVLRFDRGWPTDWENIVGPPINYFSLGAEF
jgi:hypothetical protein